MHESQQIMTPHVGVRIINTQNKRTMIHSSQIKALSILKSLQFITGSLVNVFLHIILYDL